MLYTAGFPCQPYSMLSTTRRMLNDENSKQLWAVSGNIKRTRPFDSQLNRLFNSIAHKLVAFAMRTLRINIMGYD